MITGVEMLHTMVDNRLTSISSEDERKRVVSEFIRRAILSITVGRRSQPEQEAEVQHVRVLAYRLCIKHGMEDKTIRTLLPPTQPPPSNRNSVVVPKSGPKHSLDPIGTLTELLRKDVSDKGNTKPEILALIAELNVSDPEFLRSMMKSENLSARRLFKCLCMRYPEVDKMLNSLDEQAVG